MATDAYAWYRSALAGAAVPITDKPECGFFRRRARKDGPWLPAAIWMGKDKLVCRVGHVECDPHEEWTWLAKNPMPQEDVRTAFSTGKWPSEILLEPTVGHNGPPADLSTMARDDIERATDWAKKNPTIDSKVNCDIAANLAAMLVKRANEVDEHRTKEKEPHLQAGRDVDAKWKPIVDDCKAAARALKDIAGRWMAAEEVRLMKAERERQAAERERIDAERAKAAALNQPPPPEPVVVPAKTKVQSGGARGARMGLKDVWIAEVTDHALALEFFKENRSVREVVFILATEKAKSEKEACVIPGVKVTKTRKAQ